MGTMDNNGTLDGVDDSITNNGTCSTLLFQMKMETVSAHNIILTTVLNSSILNIEDRIVGLVSIEGTDMKTAFKLKIWFNWAVSETQ